MAQEENGQAQTPQAPQKDAVAAATADRIGATGFGGDCSVKPESHRRLSAVWNGVFGYVNRS
jgi:hypothetical protein